MKVLITGVCGFAGRVLTESLLEVLPNLQIWGIDNFIRPGSEQNRDRLRRLGVRLAHGDIRVASDLEGLPTTDWVIDAAANPSVLAGVDGRTSSRQLVEHNLSGTINLLEFCKAHRAGFILLSTSRVYSIPPLASLPVRVEKEAFVPDAAQTLPPGLSAQGLEECFSTSAPVSLYGATKLASETLALEYGSAFNLPVWINRCGVLAGAGQFGRPDQGIFAYWINAYLRRQPLKYIGFDGKGHQVRDCLHPKDLAPLIAAQIQAGMKQADRVIHASGGADSACSLRQLSQWCSDRFGEHPVASSPEPRPFDLPWVVLNSDKAQKLWGWKPSLSLFEILDEIAVHAEAHPDWLKVSAPL